jgi:hypothetical protein
MVKGSLVWWRNASLQHICTVLYLPVYDMYVRVRLPVLYVLYSRKEVKSWCERKVISIAASGFRIPNNSKNSDTCVLPCLRKKSVTFVSQPCHQKGYSTMLLDARASLGTRCTML